MLEKRGGGDQGKKPNLNVKRAHWENSERIGHPVWGRASSY